MGAIIQFLALQAAVMRPSFVAKAIRPNFSLFDRYIHFSSLCLFRRYPLKQPPIDYANLCLPYFMGDSAAMPTDILYQGGPCAPYGCEPRLSTLGRDTGYFIAYIW